MRVIRDEEDAGGFEAAADDPELKAAKMLHPDVIERQRHLVEAQQGSPRGLGRQRSRLYLPQAHARPFAVFGDELDAGNVKGLEDRL